MGKASQRKGRTAELELCSLLNQNGFTVRPGNALSFGKEPDIIGIENIHAEVKRCETVRLSAWMKQASSDAEKFNDGLPVIFHRRSREEWLCTMRLSDWIKLYSKER